MKWLFSVVLGGVCWCLVLVVVVGNVVWEVVCSFSPKVVFRVFVMLFAWLSEKLHTRFVVLGVLCV